MQLRLLVRTFTRELQGVTWASALEEKHTYSILQSTMPSVPQKGELGWEYIPCLRSSWRKSNLSLSFSHSSFRRSHRGFGVALKMLDPENGEKRKVEACYYLTIYAVYLCSNRVIYYSETGCRSELDSGIAWFVESPRTSSWYRINSNWNRYLSANMWRESAQIILSTIGIEPG